MDLVRNQSITTPSESDKVDSGLRPKQNPTVGKDGRAPLSHAISGIDVNGPNDKASKRQKNNTPAPQVPKGAVRDSRIGGTVALLCAAAISAQTLFSLGRLIGLSPWTAWLLPAALDVYAMTATRVAFQVPVGHAARDKAIWNARVALFFTISSNCLYHAMHLAAGHHNWTPADWALVGVSALPPIVVERLLHLQSIVNTGDAPLPVEELTGNRKPSEAGSGSSDRKQRPEASTSAPASDPLPVSAPAGSPTASSRSLPVASVASRHAASGPIPIQRAERLKVVRDWIDGAGGDKKSVPLKEIQERFGVSQATASRMRDEAAVLPSKPATQAEQAGDEEPERAREAS